MNAVLSAQSLPWRQSAAFDASLRLVDVDPVDVYEFVGRSTFDPGFRERVLADARGVLDQCGLPTQGQIWAPGLIDEKLRLLDDEQAAVDELTASLRVNGLEGERATERGALREGLGMPAVAALVVVVVVVLAVYVFLVSIREQ